MARARAAGARVRRSSRWVHGVSVVAPAATLRALARDPALARLQLVAAWRRPAPTPELERVTATELDTCPAGGDPTYGPSLMPYRRLNLRPLADRGYDGAGVRIGIFDTGFDTQNPAFAGVPLVAQRDFVFGDSVVRDEPGDSTGAQLHGTAVWSLFAGLVPGRLRGIARGASYLLAKTEDVRSETPVEEDNYVAALEWADSIGVDVVSTSLAYLVFDPPFRSYQPADLNGDVAVTTRAVDSAAARGIVVVTAAGNSGPVSRTIWTPADADSGLAIGAEDSLGTIAPFSSRGPTADGRIKPDLTAPGVAVCAVVAPDVVRRLSGTSLATPLVAAGAALVKQAHGTLGPVALAEALRRFASAALAPDTIRGWGTPDVTRSAVFPAGVQGLEPAPGPMATATPRFRWTVDPVLPSARPIQFRLRIASDSALSAVLVDTVLVDVEEYQLRRLPKPGTRLFWRVYATAATGERASTRVLGPGVVPPWATLLTFDDPAGATTSDSQPTFAWRATAIIVPPGPFTYDLIVRARSADAPDRVFPGLVDTSLRLPPPPLERNGVYRWLLVVHAGADTSLVASRGTFLVHDAGLPPATLLYQSFPNPFPTPLRDATCIWFDLAEASPVELDILDLRGRLVRRVIPDSDLPSILPAGRYGRGPVGGPLCDPRLSWDGTTADGRTVPAGVYLYRLKTSQLTLFKRMVFRGRSP